MNHAIYPSTNTKRGIERPLVVPQHCTVLIDRVIELIISNGMASHTIPGIETFNALPFIRHFIEILWYQTQNGHYCICRYYL